MVTVPEQQAGTLKRPVSEVGAERLVEAARGCAGVLRETKPSWYLVTTQDQMIPPPAQHTMASRIGATLTEVAASHSVYVSQPEAVATVIAQAAAGAADQ
jgi:pimeloyl-ACP methyl ester carboxylesterase